MPPTQSAISGKILVIARSARMLAKLTVDAGFKPFAVDCFADEDTRQLAVEMVQVNSLALRHLQASVELMRCAHGLTHVVYGSGFEQHAETLDYLESNFVVLGNSAKVFRRFQDKQAFFANLSELDIPYPETVFAPAEIQQVSLNRGDWLTKPTCGEGGAEISLYDPNTRIETGRYYWQRHLQGQSMSALFLAGQGRVQLLGFNRQWAQAIDDEHQFVFSGVINRAALPVVVRQLVLDWLTKLVGVYRLQGLGSLDFMRVDGRCYVLEINPRIPASAQLYGSVVFSKHAQACLGVLGGSVLPEPKGYQILYARNALTIPAGLHWPEWVVDRPVAGSLIGKGEPICSIIAAGKSAEEVEKRLRHQQNFIEKLFTTGL